MILLTLIKKLLTWLGTAYTTLKNDKVFSLIFVGAIVAMLLWFSQTCGKSNDVPLEKYNKDIATWQDTTKKLLADNDHVTRINIQTQHQMDSLTAVNAKLGASNDVLKKHVVVLTGRADSLFKVASSDTSICVNLCDIWRSAAIQYKSVVDSQQLIINQDSIRYANEVEAYRLLGIRYDTATVQIFRLSNQLKNVPIYKEQKFLGIFPLPTRTTALVTGIITGVVVTSAVISLAHK